MKERGKFFRGLTMATFLPRLDRLWWYLALISAMSIIGQELIRSSAMAAPAEFEGFGDESEELDEEISSNFPLHTSIPSPIHSNFETHHGPPEEEEQQTLTENPNPNNKDSEIQNPSSKSIQSESPQKSSKYNDYWDEDEFEGIPNESHNEPQVASSSNPSVSKNSGAANPNYRVPPRPQNYYIEMVCVTFLIAFAVNFFVGRKENEGIALAWAAQFATKDGIFEKNFSLLGTGDGNDTPLLLKEGQNVFKFYASGRRYCQGLLATMEMQSRHDLISRVYNWIVATRDEINIEVYMNEDGMDQVVFALARKKVAKTMHKESKDLNQYANLLTTPSNRKWVTDELIAISESREVASDLITDTVLDQVFGEKAFQKYGKDFVSLHFTDQYPFGSHKKILTFKFSLPSASKMADMTRLIAIVPYYIDLVGRYKLSTQAHNKAEAARTKVAQELYKEQQLARQEAIQKRKEERKKASEETEAQLSAEAIRKKEEKDRQRQMKKSMPRMRMTRVH